MARQTSQDSSAASWPSIIAAALSAGLLVGLVVGCWMVLTNPVQGFTARFVLIAISVVAYATVLALPLTAAIAAVSKFVLGPERSSGRSLVMAGIAVVAAAATARYAFDVTGDLGDGYGLGEIVARRPYVAIAPIITFLSAAMALGGAARIRRPGTGWLIAAAAVLVVAALPSNSNSLPRQAHDSEIKTEVVDTLTASDPSSRVALLGFDGLDPKLLATFVDAGMMPNFKRFLAESAYKELRTLDEGLSPPIWTTFATGVVQTDHGIHDFFVRELAGVGVDLSSIRRYPRGLGAVSIFSRLVKSNLVHERPITPADRQAAAVWNLLSDAGLEVSVVDWMATWPAEPVSGTLVSDRSFFVANQGELSVVTDDVGTAGLALRLVTTEAIVSEGDSARLCTPEPDCLEHLPVIPRTEAVDVRDTPTFHREENVYYTEAAESALADPSWDVAIYYSHLPDFINHRLVPSELENLYKLHFETPNEILSRDVYLDVDRTLGQVLDLLPKDVVVVLVSDHGVEFEGRGDSLKVGHHLGPNGVLMVRPSEGKPMPDLPEDPTILSIAPTVLAIAGVPVPEYMEGPVMTGILRSEFGDAAALKKIDLAMEPAVDAAHSVMTEGIEESSRARLQALGYVD